MTMFHNHHLVSRFLTAVISDATLSQGPDPWAASVVVEWDWLNMGLSRRRRSRIVRKSLRGVTEEDYQTRYDNIMDRTIIYFRNKDDAVSAYFYLS